MRLRLRLRGAVAPIPRRRAVALRILQWQLSMVLALRFGSAVEKTSGLSWQMALREGVYLPQQLGVQHLHMSGPVPLENGSTAIADVHVYLKGLETSDGGLRIRAVAYFYDPLQITKAMTFGIFDIHMLATADWMVSAAHRPVFSLTPLYGSEPQHFEHAPLHTASPMHALEGSGPGGDRWRFQVGHDDYRAALPYVLTTEIKAEELHRSNDFRFCINDWYMCALLPTALLQGKVLGSAGRASQHDKSSEPKFYSVIKPMFGMDPSLAFRLLYHRTLFHRAIGFHGTLLYERGDQLPHLLDDAHMQELLATEQLHVMLWTHDQNGLPLMVEPQHRGSYDQWTIYTHAALALWGSNSYLLMADFDEFLKLPQGVTIQRALAPGGCLHAGAAAQASLQRFNYNCNGTGTDAGVGGLLAYLSTCDRRESGVHEHIKSLVFADAVAYWQVHDGFFYQEYAEAADAGARVPVECVSLVHLHSLLTQREHVEATQDADVEWRWPLHALADDAHRGDALEGTRVGRRRRWW